MTDSSGHVDHDRGEELVADDEDYVGRPLWVKWFATLALLLVVLYVLLWIASAGTGTRSPERHQSVRATSASFTLDQRDALAGFSVASADSRS